MDLDSELQRTRFKWMEMVLKKKHLQVVKIWFIIQLQPPFISLQT